MLAAVNQDLRVHSEGAIAGQRQAIEGLGCHTGCQQGRDGKAHIRSAGFRKGLTGSVILNDLEPIGLHIPGVKETDHILSLGPGCGNLDGSRLGQHECTPIGILQNGMKCAFHL